MDDDGNSKGTGGRGEEWCYWNVKFISQIVPPISLGELYARYDERIVVVSNCLYLSLIYDADMMLR